jgi:hypothetical protein
MSTRERRDFLILFAAGTAGLVAAPGSLAQGTRQIREIRGEVLVNGRRAGTSTSIRPGDTVSTGSDGWLRFVHGADAFFLRARTEMRLETGMAGGALTALRLVTGALGGVFGKGGRRTIYAPNVTAGIRGTGVYLETRTEGTYACACFGAVELVSEADKMDRAIVLTKHHHAHLVMSQPKNDSRLVVMPQQNHTDAEMDGLERLVRRRAPWTG